MYAYSFNLKTETRPVPETSLLPYQITSSHDKILEVNNLKKWYVPGRKVCLFFVGLSEHVSTFNSLTFVD